jgi:iron complex outermembrane recepter protein
MKNFSFAQRGIIAACAAACASLPLLSFAQTTPELKPVVVTADRLPGSPQEQIAGVSVITAQDIARSGVSTIPEALMRLLGVTGRQDFYGGGNYALDLRGFGETAGSNQVIIVDGVRLHEADLSTARLSGIGIDSVEKIEVIRGSGAVLFGGGATGGVIVITTKAGRGLQRQTGAQAYAAVGSDGLREARAGGTYANGGLTLDVNAQKRRADNHRENFASKSDDLAASVQWRGDAFRIGARVSQDALDSALPGGLTSAEFASNPRQSVKPGERASIDNTIHSIFAEASLGSWLMSADMGWRAKALRSSTPSSQYDADIASRNGSLRAMQSLSSTTWANNFTAGYETARWTRDTLSVSAFGAFNSQASQNTHAIFLRDELTWKPTGTQVSAGMRSENMRQFESNSLLSPTAKQGAWEFGLKQNIESNLAAYGRVGKSFRIANVDEFSYTSPGLLLLPQTSRDFEVGVQFQRAKTSADIRFYRHQLKNEIGFDPAAPDPFGGAGANANFDDTKRSGAEFDVKHELSPQLALQVNAAWRNARFTKGAYAGNRLALVPARTLSLRADWSPAAGHRLVGGVQWVAAQTPDFANECRIPSYETVDMRYSYQWKDAEFSLGATNLLDRKFYTQAFSCAAGVTGGIYPEAGRQLKLAVKLSF